MDFPLAPVSFQATGVKKEAFKEVVKREVQNYEYLLMGDVKLEMQWYIHEQDRYETDSPPDVDNIIKPLQDALCGPEGILIDDTQIQEVCCYWIDSYTRNQKIVISVKFFPDEWKSKRGLIFVHLGKGLCMPINETLPPKICNMSLDTFEKMLHSRNELISKGVDYYTAREVMSVQRVFHKSRLSRFRVIEINEFRKSLLGKEK